jgi:hypothetical protein
MKKGMILIAGVIIFGMLGACNSTKLAASFDKETVEASAKQVIDYLNSGDFDSVNAMVCEDGKEVLSSEVLSDAVNKTYGKAGSFVEYKGINIIGRKEKKVDYAVVIVKAKYEKQNVLFTISFDSNLEVIGLYMK